MFDWDGANREHIAEHGIEPFEAEEAMTDPKRMKTDVYNTPFEKRQGIVGATEDGRILFVVYTKRGGKFRVVTARDADSKERRRYQRRP